MEPEPKTAPVEINVAFISVIWLIPVEDVTNGAPSASDAPEMSRQASLEAETCAPEPAAEQPSQEVLDLASNLDGGTHLERIERVCKAYRFGRFDRETANRIEHGEERRFRAPSPTTTSRRGVARYYAVLRANRSDFAKDKDVAAKAAWTKEYLTYLCLVKDERVKDESHTYGADTVSRRFRTQAETTAYYAGSGIPLPVQL